MKLVNHHRNCVRCRQRKPLRGGATLPGGRGWICAECRQKPSSKPRVPAAA